MTSCCPHVHQYPSFPCGVSRLASQERAGEFAVLDVTTDVSGVGEDQVQRQGSDETSSPEVDIGDDNYRRLIEEQGVSALPC